ncbi:MAG: GrpB family protein [Bacillota bacterium]|uniref:GrpB family protein n=1 Tax=Rossellomorea sp. FM04394 TaxID=3243076 RepID=UPI0035A6368C
MTINKPIVQLSPYNPKWKIRYIEEEAKIIDAIGPSLIGIEHIGSTSVEGLDAKPIIDIMVGVDDLDVISSFIEPLGKVDYEYVHKPELIDRRFFRKGEWGRGTCHLHICEIEGSEWTDKILFRDYLRTYPEAAGEYSTLKKGLAYVHQSDRPRYTQEKEPFIREILRRATNDERM